MSAKWRNIIREKLAPIYNGIRRRGQVAEITLPADYSRDFDYDYYQWEMTFFFRYEDTRFAYEDMYGDIQFSGGEGYVTCYYVVKSDGTCDDQFVEVGQTLEDVLMYLVRNFPMERLLNMHVGCIDDVLSYTHG